MQCYCYGLSLSVIFELFWFYVSFYDLVLVAVVAVVVLLLVDSIYDCSNYTVVVVINVVVAILADLHFQPISRFAPVIFSTVATPVHALMDRSKHMLRIFFTCASVCS